MSAAIFCMQVAFAYKHALIEYYRVRLYVGFRLQVVNCLGAESRYDLIISTILLACSRFLFYTILSVPPFFHSDEWRRV